jgi:electron transfer flavoprotein beta subunit
MKIVVILRLEPVLTEELELTDDGSDIDREWIGLDLNQFDDQALEQAVLLKERSGASVVALAIDSEGSERMLKAALARGADEGLVIPMQLEHGNSRSSRALAPVYASALADLVLVGVLSNSDLYGELAPYLAAHINFPQASAVSEVLVGDGKVTVRQEYAGGRAALLDLKLPAVVGLQTADQPPRYVAGSKLRDLLNTEIPKLELEAVPGADLAEATTLKVPELSGNAEMLEGSSEDIAAAIHAVLQEKGFA